MTNKIIKVTCEAADYVSIDELTELQGDLKSLHKNKAEKLMKSIIKYGFCFPAFIWKKDNEKYIVDACQRVRVLKELIKEGWQIEGGKIPVVWIHAKNKKDAKEKILLASSMYGETDHASLQLFIEESEIDIEDMLPMIDIPYVDLNLEKPEIPDKPATGNGRQLVKCPECGFEFTPEIDD